MNLLRKENKMTANDDELMMGFKIGGVVGMVSGIIIGIGLSYTFSSNINNATVFRQEGKSSIVRIDYGRSQIDLYQNPNNTNEYLPQDKYTKVLSEQIVNEDKSQIQMGLLEKITAERPLVEK
jgi:hypothetical protein